MSFVIQNNSRMNTMNQGLKPEFKMACWMMWFFWLL